MVRIKNNLAEMVTGWPTKIAKQILTVKINVPGGMAGSPIYLC